MLSKIHCNLQLPAGTDLGNKVRWNCFTRKTKVSQATNILSENNWRLFWNYSGSRSRSHNLNSDNNAKQVPLQFAIASWNWAWQKSSFWRQNDLVNKGPFFETRTYSIPSRRDFENCWIVGDRSSDPPDLHSDIFWYILIYSDIFRYILIYSDIFWNIMIYSDILRYILIYSDILWYIMIYYDILW